MAMTPPPAADESEPGPGPGPGLGPGKELLERAADQLRHQPAPDTRRAVERAVGSARRWRRTKPLTADLGDLGHPPRGVVTVAEHVLADAVRRAGDDVPAVLVTHVRVRRVDDVCTGLEVECAADYGTDLAATGAAVADVAAAVLRDLLGPGAPGRDDVDVAVVDVLEG